MIVKICGLKTLQDSLAACQAGADMLGFNFYQASPRFIQIEDCHHIVAEVKSAYPEVICVGVFVNHSVGQITKIMSLTGLDLAQLSGDDTGETHHQLGEIGFHALRSHSMGELDAALKKIRHRKNPPAFLLDSVQKGSYGGSGKTGNWHLAAEAARYYHILLAGGLDPDNVDAAIKTVRPWGVDVASGVESQRGVKDAKKIVDFIHAAKRAYQFERS